jgi:hypothetical protein
VRCCQSGQRRWVRSTEPISTVKKRGLGVLKGCGAAVCLDAELGRHIDRDRPELASRLISREDADVSQAVADFLKEEGVDIRVDTKVVVRPAYVGHSTAEHNQVRRQKVHFHHRAVGQVRDLIEPGDRRHQCASAHIDEDLVGFEHRIADLESINSTTSMRRSPLSMLAIAD